MFGVWLCRGSGAWRVLCEQRLNEVWLREKGRWVWLRDKGRWVWLREKGIDVAALAWLREKASGNAGGCACDCV